MSGSHVVEQILILSIIVLSMLLIFVSFLHLYAKWFLYRNPSRSRRGDFTAGYQEQLVLPHGLKYPSLLLLKTIPVTPFDPKDFKEGLECAVCLSEVGEGEKARILPKCNHGFHVECIDMWFYSHSTCPICRQDVVSDQSTRQTVQQDSTTVLLTQVTASTLTNSELEEEATANYNHHQAPPILPASSQTATPDLVIEIPT